MYWYSYDGVMNLVQVENDRCPGSVNQPYQYVGQLSYYTHWMEPNFGLLQLGVRFYDPEVGRFGQRDPADEGWSLYVYVASNPAVYVDPSGLRLSPTQCWVIKKILDDEKKYGTQYAACKWSNTWGTCPMGEEFDNKPVDSAVGVIDLDWYTDLMCAGATPETVDAIYVGGKCLWNVVRCKWVWPYRDPKERVAVGAIRNGNVHYRDLFPPALIARECKNAKPPRNDDCRSRRRRERGCRRCCF